MIIEKVLRVTITLAIATCQGAFCSQTRADLFAPPIITHEISKFGGAIAANIRCIGHQIVTAFHRPTMLVKRIFFFATTAMWRHPKTTIFATGIAIYLIHKFRNHHTQQPENIKTYNLSETPPQNLAPEIGQCASNSHTSEQRVANKAIPFRTTAYPQKAQKNMSPLNPERYEKKVDDISGQIGLIGTKDVSSGTRLRQVLALVPLPGQKIPCPLKLCEEVARPIDTKTAREACHVYCAQNQLLNEVYNQLRKGETTRTLMYGKTGVGKNFLACALPQESGNPYSIINVPIVSLLTEWHNCQYAGLKDMINQAIDHYHKTSKKVVLIIDYIDALEDKDNAACCGVPCYPGIEALHEFFDLQESGDSDACNISIIALTDKPHSLPNSILSRFSHKILLDNPNTEQRSQIIMSLIDHYKTDLDHSVLHNVKKITTMTEGLNARDLKNIFSKACTLSYGEDISDHKITWRQIEQAHREIANL